MIGSGRNPANAIQTAAFDDPDNLPRTVFSFDPELKRMLLGRSAQGRLLWIAYHKLHRKTKEETILSTKVYLDSKARNGLSEHETAKLPLQELIDYSTMPLEFRNITSERSLLAGKSAGGIIFSTWLRKLQEEDPTASRKDESQWTEVVGSLTVASKRNRYLSIAIIGGKLGAYINLIRTTPYPNFLAKHYQRRVLGGPCACANNFPMYQAQGVPISRRARRPPPPSTPPQFTTRGLSNRTRANIVRFLQLGWRTEDVAGRERCAVSAVYRVVENLERYGSFRKPVQGQLGKPLRISDEDGEALFSELMRSGWMY
ncbi:hypothetical protein P154DRAFT_590665 [Amniculicola lignicola CBS 123094]|uniref:Uncharacterized protein n=1 Tax=Amniculicola lignicola CBS 123094 TaxID=1392246 RepID=A0A6A5WNM5_9PLEO|nr:hypothetical protein P154DRAFT_590665 [Amniculicola lignicola CBS 123094]